MVGSRLRVQNIQRLRRPQACLELRESLCGGAQLVKGRGVKKGEAVKVKSRHLDSSREVMRSF